MHAELNFVSLLEPDRCENSLRDLIHGSDAVNYFEQVAERLRFIKTNQGTGFGVIDFNSQWNGVRFVIMPRVIRVIMTCTKTLSQFFVVDF